MPVAEKRLESAACSFCLRPNTEVTTLVAGPGVFICDTCVTLCVQVIDEKPHIASHLTPWDQVGSLDEVLTNLPRVAAAGTQVEQNLVEWVRKARSRGATWAQIGDVLDMTRQSAWERFAGDE